MNEAKLTCIITWIDGGDHETYKDINANSIDEMIERLQEFKDKKETQEFLAKNAKEIDIVDEPADEDTKDEYNRGEEDES